MRHGRHYTVEQANAALPWVAERLGRLRAGRERLSDDQAREALDESAPRNGGGRPGRVVSEGFLAMRAALAELQAVEVVVRDVDRGLVDFPTLRQGEEVYLCWLEGESEIAFWHPPDSGFAGRRPI
jgi:hypothetical protein